MRYSHLLAIVRAIVRVDGIQAYAYFVVVFDPLKEAHGSD